MSPAKINDNPKSRSDNTQPKKSANRADSDAHWTFLSNHSHVLILIKQDSSIVIREIAARVGITERAVQRIIAELEKGGFLEREKLGRQNHYRVLDNKPLRHPIERHKTIRDLLNLILEDA